MAKCTCFVTPPEMWTTHYGMVEPGSMYEPNPDCAEHFRQRPPHRLPNGDWSDGVNRDLPLRTYRYGQHNPDRLTVCMAHCDTTADGRKVYEEFMVYRGNELFMNGESDTFPTFDEAIDWANHLARTNQGENA